MNNIDVKFGGYHKEFIILTPENYEKPPLARACSSCL